jgi:hypothetical protein
LRPLSTRRNGCVIEFDGHGKAGSVYFTKIDSVIDEIYRQVVQRCLLGGTEIGIPRRGYENSPDVGVERQRVFLEEIVSKLGAKRVWLRSRRTADTESKLTGDPTLADLMTVLLALLKDVGYGFQGHKDEMWQDHQGFDSGLWVLNSTWDHRIHSAVSLFPRIPC